MLDEAVNIFKDFPRPQPAGIDQNGLSGQLLHPTHPVSTLAVRLSVETTQASAVCLSWVQDTKPKHIFLASRYLFGVALCICCGSCFVGSEPLYLHFY